MSKHLLPVLVGAALAVSLFPADAHALSVPAGSRIKASGAAVYYLGPDNKRYAFPNQGTYLSWFADFNGVITLTDAELASFPLGGAVTYRPGVRLLKIQSDPKTYAVAPGGELRWVTTEAIAVALYGSNWNQKVDDISDAFFATYRSGADIVQAADFSPLAATQIAVSIGHDKGLSTPPSATLERLQAFALADLNAHRAAAGKPPLTLNTQLSVIAQAHSSDMGSSGTLSHTGSLGESADDRIRTGKVTDSRTRTLITLAHPANASATGENIAQMSVGAGGAPHIEAALTQMHQLFMNEPVGQANHRGNMLSETHAFTEVGIGIFTGNGMVWLTEDFFAK